MVLQVVSPRNFLNLQSETSSQHDEPSPNKFWLRIANRGLDTYSLFTLNDTENETETDAENDKNGFHCNMQYTSHCTETDNNTDSHWVLYTCYRSRYRYRSRCLDHYIYFQHYLPGVCLFPWMTNQFAWNLSDCKLSTNRSDSLNCSCASY